MLYQTRHTNVLHVHGQLVMSLCYFVMNIKNDFVPNIKIYVVLTTVLGRHGNVILKVLSDQS